MVLLTLSILIQNESVSKLYKPCQNCTLNTIHYRGNIHHFFYIFGYLLFFPNI